MSKSSAKVIFSCSKTSIVNVMMVMVMIMMMMMMMMMMMIQQYCYSLIISKQFKAMGL